MANNNGKDRSMPTDASLVPMARGSRPNNQSSANMIVSEQQVINTRTMRVAANGQQFVQTNPTLPMQANPLGDGDRPVILAPSGGTNYSVVGGGQLNVYYQSSQGRTAEQEFTEWAISQDLSDSTIQLLKSHGIVSKRSLQRATDADIEALASLLPLFQQRYLKEAKVSLSGGQLSTSSSASNVVSSSDEVDGRKFARNNSSASTSSASSAPPAYSTSEPSIPTHLFDDDNFLFGLSMKTSCTSTSIQGMGLKLLESDITLSQCNDPDLTVKIYKIYVQWRKQMREKQTTFSEMKELLQCALSHTLNDKALEFLDASLNPSSVPPQKTLFDSDSFFFDLAEKTSDIAQVGTMLLGSLDEVEKCSHDMCRVYLKWRSKMVIKKVNDQEMRKILWDVLHATENGAARDFLKDSLDDHDLQLATAASLAI